MTSSTAPATIKHSKILSNHWLRWGTVSDGTTGKAHFHRLPLLLWRSGFSIYLHHFVGPDDSRDPHDHPKWFLCVGLRGGYKEAVYDESGTVIDLHIYSAPFVRFFPATHIHKIITDNCWTLVINGPVRRKWGFWRGGQWLSMNEYAEKYL